jgi:copper chaperone CopZ
MPRLRIHVQIEGLLSVHAVRAVWTALGAVPGVRHAEVSMKGALLDTDGPVDRELLEECLAHAGVRVVGVTVEKGSLPLL